MPLKSGIETILHRKFINFSFKAQNSQNRWNNTWNCDWNCYSHWSDCVDFS